MQKIVRRLAKSLLPTSVRAKINIALGKTKPDLSQMSSEQVFATIYQNGLWGVSPIGGARYWSGAGSHDAEIVKPYVAAVRSFLAELTPKPIIADIGCGDFNVGRQVVDLVEHCIACDIFDGVVEENKSRYKALSNVEFRVLDLAKDELPKVDIIFVRQVLQHLSNNEIHAFVSNIPRTCHYLVVTEHIAAGHFEPNVDMPTGVEDRLSIGSGIVLTDPPFNLLASEEHIICEVPENRGIIRTVVYRIPSAAG